MTTSKISLADIIIDPDDYKQEDILSIPTDALPDIAPSMIINDWLYLGNGQVFFIIIFP